MIFIGIDKANVFSLTDCLRYLTIMNKEYEVTMWIESDGEPEDDPCLTKVVVAQNKHAALEAARLFVRDENPEVNYARIWAWSLHRISK
jgi:hypothetical protein